jgi:hypothetical protein
LWSTRDEYRSPVTDNPTYNLQLTLGEHEHRISDYVGARVGMPAAVSEFEGEVDKVSRAIEFVHFSGFALERLRVEGFDFRSRAAGAMLAAAIVDREANDEAAMARLVALGAPLAIRSEDLPGLRGRRSGSDSAPQELLDLALREARVPVVDAMLARGALKGASQERLDAAFRAAVEGGRLELAQRIWNALPGRHPSLQFMEAGAKQPTSVLMALNNDYPPEGKQWDGLAISRWLAELGCDPNSRLANGSTLLHIAAGANDVELLRWALARGIDASTPGDNQFPALGSARSDQVALALLEAGSTTWFPNDTEPYREYAMAQHWRRTVAWLDAHPEAVRRRSN